MYIQKRSNLLLLLVLQVAWLNCECIVSYLLTDYLVSVCVHSQVVSFNCPTFCPEVLAKYHCVITSAQVRWEITGSYTDDTSYGAADAIGLLKQVGNSPFTANKTGSNSFSLIFTANVEFNNIVTVICTDLADGNSVTNRIQCTIELKGKKQK